MAPPTEKLPSELVGELLCRLPTKSLARSRAVCKTWNAFWEDKSLLKKYLTRARPQFILRTNSQICSVEINLNLDDDNVSPIEVRKMPTDIPCQMITSLVHYDGLLLSELGKKGFAVWYPCVRQCKWIVPETIQEFRFCGVGYDSSRPETGYMIFGYGICFDATRQLCLKVAIYECKSNAWKFINAPCEKGWRIPQLETIVCLTGNLYWVAYDSKTCEYFIRCFDFSKEMFKNFCLLPCNEEDLGYTQVLAAFRGDRLSVLRQSYFTRKIEILVTKKKIDGNGEAVAWISFMTVSIPNLPRLQQKLLSSQPSYFIDNIDDKRLFLCTCDETGHACIYIVKGDVFKKVRIDAVVDLWPSHLTCIPSFVPIPFEQEGSQV